MWFSPARRHSGSITAALAPYAALTIAVLLGLAGRGSAVDGVLEISQTCALNGGCFSGDAAGFPVTISSPGSYRLTSNLYRGLGRVTGIEVNVDGVTIDLNGFAIDCALPGNLCAFFGIEGYGINAGGRTAITVLNGTIRNTALQGILAGDRARVENVHAETNGVSAAASSIEVGDESIVVGNRVVGSGQDGIRVGLHSVVSGNTSSSNAGDGIQAESGSTVTGNSTDGNTDDGIDVNWSCVVVGNTAFSNSQDGIAANTGSTVKDNSVRLNGQFGLRLGADAGYANNVILGGSTVTGGIEIGTNICGTNTTCP